MKFLLSIIFFGALLFSQSSFAAICLQDGTNSTATISFNGTIAVPSTAPKGMILWRSPDYVTEIICYQETSWGMGEDVYFYLSPTDQGMVQLGPDLEFGVNLAGVDMTCSSLPKCRTKIGSIEPCIGPTCTSRKNRFTLSYNFFVAKRSTAEQSKGKDGPLAGIASYDAFQIDGANGINAKPDKNFRMTVQGLEQIRFIDCFSQLQILPQTIDFGRLHVSTAKASTVAKEKDFSILISKSCSSVYGISAVMTPIDATVQGGDTLVPRQNDSVGIMLLRDNKVALPFHREFELTSPTGDQLVTKRFTAQLKWLTDQPKVGSFSAGATFDIYYK